MKACSVSMVQDYKVSKLQGYRVTISCCRPETGCLSRGVLVLRYARVNLNPAGLDGWLILRAKHKSPPVHNFSYLCHGDNLFYRIPACPRVRKVRTTQSAILPNGKVLRLNTVGTASATENIPSRCFGIRVKTRGKSPRLVAAMQHEGKPYGLKDQIYRE